MNIQDDRVKVIAENFMKNNMLEEYVRAALDTARKNGVVICDVYTAWKKMRAVGINTTELLVNKLNHPTRELNEMTAFMLMQIILEQ